MKTNLAILLGIFCALLACAGAEAAPRAATKYHRYLEAHYDVANQSYSAFTGPATYTRAVDSATVTYVTDLSGKGRNLVQATAGDRPVYVASGVNSLPSITCNGDWLDSSSAFTANLNDGATIFVVYFHGSTSGIKVLMGTASDKFYIARNSLTTSFLVGGLSAQASANLTTAALGTTAVEAYVYDKTAGKLKIFRNLAKVADQTVTGTANFGTTALRIGDSQSGSFAWPGSFCETQIYSRALSDAEVRAEQLALMNKYGLNVPTLIGDGHSFIVGYQATYYATTPQDSLMVLLGDALPSTVTKKTFGVNGATTADNVSTQLLKVLPWVTDNTTLLFVSGINDAKASGPSITAATTIANFATYVKAARALGANVLIGTVNRSNFAGQPSDTNTKVAAINAAIRLQWPAWGAKGLVDFDADPQMGGATAYSSAYFTGDFLHWGPLGHAKAYQLAKPLVFRQLGLDFGY